jgi:hypothetical protein
MDPGSALRESTLLLTYLPIRTTCMEVIGYSFNALGDCIVRALSLRLGRQSSFIREDTFFETPVNHIEARDIVAYFKGKKHQIVTRRSDFVLTFRHGGIKI